jgi:hypothetical protein
MMRLPSQDTNLLSKSMSRPRMLLCRNIAELPWGDWLVRLEAPEEASW